MQTYASAARSMNIAITKDLKAIMLETKYEEIAEELDQKSRVNNLIIHGKQEINATDDENFAKNLFKDLQVETITIKQIERIEQNNDLQQRPIKLVLKSEEDKKKVFDNLKHLKDRTTYKGINVTYDYTQRERSMIKKCHDEAKERNNEIEDSIFVLKIRGTPNRGLFLKRFMRAEQENCKI